VKITVESTSKIVEFNGIQCRVWEGRTERGVPMVAFIARVAVERDQDAGQFEAELRETPQPKPSEDVAAFPFRMLID
jgi:hypothetical protein